MRARDDLFNLIKSLSKSEKRYFTIDAQKSGDRNRNYLQLFQEINELETYDEKALKKIFPNLSSDKAYLYEAILRSMRDYRSSKSKAAQIKEQVLDARFLYEHGLYEQSEERLATAKWLSEELGDPLSQLEINKETRRLSKETSMSNFKEAFQQLKNEKNALIQMLEEEFVFLDHYDNLSIEIKEKFQVLDENVRKRIEAQYQNSDWKEPDGLLAKHRFYQANALYFHLLGDNVQASKYFLLTVDWWDKHPEIKREEFFRYIVDLSNLLQAFFSKGQWEEMAKVLESLNLDEAENHHEKRLIFQKILIYKLLFYLNTDHFKEGAKLAASIEEGLEKYEIGSGLLSLFCYNLTVLFFFLEDYAQAIRWAEYSFKKIEDSVRVDIQKAIRVIHLMALIEKDDLDKFENSARAFQRLLQNRKQEWGQVDSELAVLSFLRKIVQETGKARRQVMVEFNDYLLGLTEGGAGRSPFLALDELTFWLNKKLKK